MNVGSLFSGIGGLDAGLTRAGHRHVFLCESDPYRRDVLRARFPGVVVYDDVRAVARSGEQRRGGDAERGRGGTDASAATEFRPVRERESDPASGPPAIDLLCGGFPCQDLSVAGQRRGLAGDRSGLFFEFARIAESLRPRWLLVENVPGLLSSQSGRDFGVVLGTLAELGYGVAWRVVDSRFFGVPQRRRRVFIVGAVADGDPRAAAECAGEVLAVGTRCERHPATRGEAGADVAGALGGISPGGGWRIGADEAAVNHLVANGLVKRYGKGADSDATDTLIASTLKSQRGKAGGGIGPEETLLAFHPMQDPISGSISHALGSEESGSVAISFSENQRGELLETEVAHQLTSGGGKPGQGYSAVREGASVRRLTPTECERLQGLPDGWTQLGETPDSRRYAALGDAVTATVGEWLGRRLAQRERCAA